MKRDKLIIDKAKNNALKAIRNNNRLESWEILERDIIRLMRKNIIIKVNEMTYLPISPYGSINAKCSEL